MCLLEDIRNYKVNDGKGQDNDNEANETVENSIFGFFDFAGVTRRNHITNATDDYDDYGYDAKNTDDTVKNINDIISEIVAFVRDCVR